MFGVQVRNAARIAGIFRHFSPKLTPLYRSSTWKLPFTSGAMKIRLVPALDDNYMYLLIDEQTRQCAAVDPVQPSKILSAVKEEGVTLTSVITTHHHWDHAGGNEELCGLVKNLTVYGGDDRIGALNKKVTHGTEFKVGSLQVKCLFTPCHTAGHICYYVTSDGHDPAVFTGDTLFVGGCGRFFEGTPDQMYDAMVNTLSSLPHNTHVFCGHEYTVTNLKFAVNVEPNNTAASEKLQWAQAQREKGLPTIPSTLAEELSYNPFMRVKEGSIHSSLGQSEPVAVMGELRQRKNNFKPT